MLFTINVGINVRGVPSLTVERIRSVLRNHGIGVERVELRAPNGANPEATVIARVTPVTKNRRTAHVYNRNLLTYRLHQAAVELEQDAIAVRDDVTGWGYLVGPEAARWGMFQPELFQDFSHADAVPA